MAEHSEDSDTIPDDTLLYDVASLVEWPEEKEIIGGAAQDELQPGYITGGVRSVRSSITRWTWATARAFSIPVGSGKPCALPSELVKLVNRQQSWLFAQSNDGRFIALLQDNCLEIRSSKEDFATLVGKYSFSKDPYPQWRKLAWSLYSTAVAFSDSDGTVHVCDIKGVLLFSFQGLRIQTEQCFDYSSAICGLAFIGDEISKHKDRMHLLIATYSGTASCLEISNDYEIGYRTIFTFNFASHYTGGVSCIVYEQEHGMVIVGGCAGYLDTAVGVPRATKCGLTAWRLLSDEPYLKAISVFAENGDLHNRRSLLRKLSSVPLDIGKKFRGQLSDGVFTFALSPCSKLLVVIHLSGSLSLWEVPSMRLKRTWLQAEQPHYDDIDPDTSKSISQKKPKDYVSPQNAIDCNWWSDSAVILARVSGSLTVLGIAQNSLRNLFGDQCEWLEPAPRVAVSKNQGFLAMECETGSKTLKRQRVDTNEDSTRGDEDDNDPFLDDSDHEEKFDISGKLMNMSKRAMYNLTEMEYFRPPRKRAKLVTKMYRLVSVTKTTSEKLFEKKLEAEEYGEALALAQKYGLDGDRVFQQQWRRSAVSIASIQDYLSKISKKSWVLHECCERVPEELDAARELLKFALHATDLDELAGQNQQTSSLDTLPADDSDYEEYEGFDIEEQRRQEIRHRRKFVQKWSSGLDLNSLTLEQREMIRARFKILRYLDRLATYEYLLGGYDAARERYNRDRFAMFRQQDMLTSAIEYARKCNWRAVDALLTFHGKELREHRLAILSSFPKTLSPSEYESLLPEVNLGCVIPSPEENHRNPGDWCEEEEYQFASSPLLASTDPASKFYEENPHLDQFRMDRPTHDIVHKWYVHQAIHMDSDARDIEGALELLEFGSKHGVNGLGDLRRDLKTLEMLVYECDYDPGLLLSQVQQKTDLELFQMIMKTSSKEMFMKHLSRWGFPFLKSCDEKQAGSSANVFKQYVAQLAEEDLTFPSLMLTTFMRDRSLPAYVADLGALVDLALESVYLNGNPGQLGLVKEIHASVTKADKGVLHGAVPGAQQKVDMLEKHVFTCTMLDKYGIKLTPADIREVDSDRSKVQKLLVRLSRTAGSREPTLSRSEWNGLLLDMLKLCERIFSATCSLEAAVCLEVFIDSLLTSGIISNFEIAAEKMMRTSEEEHEASRRRFHAPQKLSYESSVALVIKSSQEYFDASSPSIGDNMLNLARECLLLITDRPPLIQEKLDLIEGVILLHHFGVDRLPLQVRLTEDRLSLVAKAVEVDAEGYKKTEALLRLGMLLRACGSNNADRKGRILVMIVNKALEHGDFQSAHCLCQELVAMPYTEAWDVCLKLAGEEGFSDVIAKRDILSYAACYCDGDKLKDVMGQMCILEAQILKEAVTEHTTQEKTDSGVCPPEASELDITETEGEQGSNLSLDKLVSTTTDLLSPSKMLENTARGTKAVLSVTGTVLSATGTVLSATSSTTRKVLSNVGNKDWWATMSRTLHDPHASALQNSDEDEVVSNADFEYQGCPEFYSDIIGNSVTRSGLQVGVTSLYQAYLRLLRLEDRAQTSLTLDIDESEVISRLVTDFLPYDLTLGISYLLLLADPEKAYVSLQNFPISALSIQAALYYFSLRFVRTVLTNDVLKTMVSLYEIAPLELIKYAVSLSPSADSSHDENARSLATYVIQLKEQLYDFSQGEKLHRLGHGIDLGRFEADAEYKQETIVGLAMTSDKEQYKLAVSLAHRSGVDLWLVLVTHLEFLFAECQDELDASELHDHIKNLNMVPELATRPKDFLERMDKHVYPFIGGKDHARLLLYFVLLSECRADDASSVCGSGLCSVSSAAHIKMIRKIKSVAPDLDYKALLTDDLSDESSSESAARVLNVLRPVLNGSNVQMLAKLLPKIPYSSHSVPASSLYLEVAKGLIWNGVGDSLELRDSIDWIHRYEECNSFLRMCSPNDLLLFFQDFLFNSRFPSLPQKVRQDVMKRGVKLCKIQGTKERKGQLDEEILSTGQSFHTVLPTFITMSKHLDSYSTTFISDMVKSAKSDPVMQKYLMLYDETRSRPEQVLILASTMLGDGRTPQFVQQFIAVAPGCKWSTNDVLKECLDGIIRQLEKADPDAFSKLAMLVGNVSAHEKVRGKVFTCKQLLELLRPVYSDASVNAKLKVDILQLLEDKLELETAEVELLMFHRTRAVISEGWGEDECCNVMEEDVDTEMSLSVASENKRLEIFNKLLRNDAELEKLKHLVMLLDIWPKFESTQTVEECWSSLLIHMVNCGASGAKETVEVVRERISRCERISAATIVSVYDVLAESGHSLFATKLALLADVPEVRKKMLAALKSVKCMGPSQCDEELIRLILEKSVAANTVETLYYPRICEYLLSGDCQDMEVHVHNLAMQLQDQGYLPEAGSLLLNFRGTHPALRTFGNALSSLSRWLHS